MPKVYDPILCMMVDEPTKARDELSLAQKKQVVVELKGFLKKSYNFSDESEYARAYEDLRHMFTTGSKKSISGLFKNTVKKTGAHDSASAFDKAIKIVDAKGGKYEIYGDVVTLKSATPATVKYETSNGFVQTIGRKKWDELAKKVNDARDSKTIDKAIRAVDAFEFGNGDQLRRNKQALESIRKLAQNITKSDDVLHDFKVMQMTASQITDKKVKAEADRIIGSIQSKLAGLVR